MSFVSPIVFDRPRAKAVVAGIFAVLASGAYIDRDFVVRRFAEAGYADHVAVRYADTLIALNTDIEHSSRWSIWGTGDRVTYSFAG